MPAKYSKKAQKSQTVQTIRKITLWLLAYMF